MPNYNAGSIGSIVYNAIDDMPDNVSGLLPTYVNQCRISIQNYTGIPFSSDSIEEKYQPAMLACTSAKAANTMSIQGSDVAEYKLDGFVVKKGKGSAMEDTATKWAAEFEKEKRELGRNLDFYQTFT